VLLVGVTLVGGWWVSAPMAGGGSIIGGWSRLGVRGELDFFTFSGRPIRGLKNKTPIFGQNAPFWFVPKW
jgi:hypothetical protein